MGSECLLGDEKVLELDNDPAIPLLSMYPKELKTGAQTKTCALMFIAALFTITQKMETIQMSTLKTLC